MWSFAEPSPDTVRSFLREQERLAFSYPEVGHSLDRSPRGYNLDHNRAPLGAGEAAFAAACEALRGWAMFPAPWTRIEPRRAPLVTGQVVAMVAHIYGVWWLNACRIVYTLDEVAPVR